MILVTGASGLLGSRVVTFLKNANKSVIGGARKAAPGTAVTHCLDLTEIEKFKNLPSVDTVIHLAGVIQIALKQGESPAHHPVPGSEIFEEVYRHNVLATANLVQWCLKVGVRRFIFASSQTVYGLPDTERVFESTIRRPLEHYAVTKSACEDMIEIASRQGLEVIILRFPGLFYETRKSGTVWEMCLSAITQKIIKVNIDYPLPFDVIHCDDVVTACALSVDCIGNGFEVFNIATGETCSLILLAERIASIVPGCRVEIEAVYQPPIALDSTKAQNKLGWFPMSLDTRLKSILEAVKNEVAAC